MTIFFISGQKAKARKEKIRTNMPEIQKLIDNNARWSDEKLRQDPEFFHRLSDKQTPEYLWIGCSDSRVPANQITGLLPGEIFVHRNIANLVMHSDHNCQSVLQYAIEELQIKHIIVCGHYGCGGVARVLSSTSHKSTCCESSHHHSSPETLELESSSDKNDDLMNNWLHEVKELDEQYASILSDLPFDEHFDRLCELNALHQAKNVVQSSAFKRARKKGQSIQVHSWIYDLNTGKIKVLDRFYSNSLDTSSALTQTSE